MLNIQPAVVVLATTDYVCQLHAGMVLSEDRDRSPPEKNQTTGGKDKTRPASSKYPDASLPKREQENIVLVGQALFNKDSADDSPLAALRCAITSPASSTNLA